MKLLIYGLNYAPEVTGIGKYTGDMARWFASQNHSVCIVTAPPYYPEWRVHKGFRNSWWQRSVEQGVKLIRCPLYIPSRPTTLKRLLHLGSFAITSFFTLLAQWRSKPDVIVVVVPTFFCSPGTLLLSWLSGASCVLHVQDFEIDAMFDLGLSEAGVVKRLALAWERWLLKKFDRVSTISSGMLDRAQQKGVPRENLILFPNWSDIGHFQGARASSELMEKLGVPSGRRVLLYSGNLGEKQGLEILLDVAASLRNRHDVFFLIVGEGAGKERLLAKAAELELPNLSFSPLQPWRTLPTLLASADVHLIIQKRGVADAVLPSKLTNILAVGGNCIITADPDTSLGQLCTDHPGIATCVEPESPNALLRGIEQSLNCPKPNQIAQKYAEQNLDKESILQNFQAQLMELSKK